MIRHYILSGWRFIKRNKFFSFINIFGLSVAFSFCAMIWFFIRHEKSYDKFHQNAENIYLLTGKSLDQDDAKPMVYLPLALSTVLNEEIPEIKKAVRVSDDRVVVRYGDKVFPENAIFADREFFEMFSFTLASGSAYSALARPSDVVITTELAKKYFGEESPVGKTLSIRVMEEEEPFVVSGVADTPPDNSSIQFSLLMRIEKRGFYDHNLKNWQSFNTPVLVELDPKANPMMIERKLARVSDKYMAKTIQNIRERKKLKDDQPAFEMAMMPLTQLHLNGVVEWYQTSDPKYIFILSGITMLILLIATINFISLAITTASSRTTEVGVRKVIGASRQQLIRQYWGESLLSALFAIVVSLVLTRFFLPVFNELTGKQFHLGTRQALTAFLFLLGIAFVISLFTGGYPALFLSSFKPSEVLKGRKTYRFKPGLMKGLVVVQYSLSAFLLISSMVMYRQMGFISHKDLGYNKDQLVVLPTYTGYNEEGRAVMNRMRNALANDPDIVNVTGASSPPSNTQWSLQGFKVKDEDKSAFVYRADYEFLSTLKIPLIAGRDFSTSYATDSSDAIIVNEAMVKSMGWKDPIGESLPWLGENDKPSTVVGVVKDFNFLSLENQVMPMILYLKDYDKIQNVIVRIRPGNTQSILGKLEFVWRQINPNRPFDYTFQSDTVAGQYQNYQRRLTIMGISTGMAVLIACLGLFGLAGILSINRRKEIGIRKVFGANTGNLWLMLNKDIFKLSILSMLIALPVAWYLVNKWLENFAYRINISWGLIAIAVAIAFLITILTVSFHSLKAALSSPVKSLRTE